jgi:polysaccharide biosynthesis protein PslH
MNGKVLQPLNILFFSKKFPLPMDTGGKIRSGKILEGLKKHCHITLLCHFEARNDAPYLDQINMFCDDFHFVPWKEVRKYSFYFLRTNIGAFLL